MILTVTCIFLNSLVQDGIFDAIIISTKEWQEAQHEGPVPTNWLTGTLYTGVFACYQSTDNKSFLDAQII